jgi:thiol-disulfide isomerase/thioredoxin
MAIIEFNDINDDFKTNTSKIHQSITKRPSVVLVWASWCPHCIIMKDDWQMLKNDVGKKVTIIEIESGNLDRIRENNSLLYKKLFPNQDKVFFPMIKMYKDSKVTNYEQERKYPTMKHHVTKHLLSSKKNNKVSKPTKKPTIARNQKGGADNAVQSKTQQLVELREKLNKVVFEAINAKLNQSKQTSPTVDARKSALQERRNNKKKNTNNK